MAHKDKKVVETWIYTKDFKCAEYSKDKITILVASTTEKTYIRYHLMNKLVKLHSKNIIAEEEFIKLRTMIESPDEDNMVVAEEILKHYE